MNTKKTDLITKEIKRSQLIVEEVFGLQLPDVLEQLEGRTEPEAEVGQDVFAFHQGQCWTIDILTKQ